MARQPPNLEEILLESENDRVRECGTPNFVRFARAGRPQKAFRAHDRNTSSGSFNSFDGNGNRNSRSGLPDKNLSKVLVVRPIGNYSTVHTN